MMFRGPVTLWTYAVAGGEYVLSCSLQEDWDTGAALLRVFENGQELERRELPPDPNPDAWRRAHELASGLYREYHDRAMERLAPIYERYRQVGRL